jgi:hypothetical protein
VTLRRLLPCGVSALLLAGAPAAAHRLLRPKADRIFVRHQEVLLLLLYEIPAGPEAERVRAAFDADRDGRLSEAEVGRIGDFLARMAVHRLTLAANGAPLTLERRSVATSGVGRITRSAAGLGARALYTAAARWRVGENRLTVRDRHKDRVFPVVATLHLAPPLTLRASSLGAYDGASRQIRSVELRPEAVWEIVFSAPERW